MWVHVWAEGVAKALSSGPRTKQNQTQVPCVGSLDSPHLTYKLRRRDELCHLTVNARQHVVDPLSIAQACRTVGTTALCLCALSVCCCAWSGLGDVFLEQAGEGIFVDSLIPNPITTWL